MELSIAFASELIWNVTSFESVIIVYCLIFREVDDLEYVKQSGDFLEPLVTNNTTFAAKS